MEAIILNAGIGSRMGALTQEKPKCLLEISDGSIIKKQVDSLRTCGISNISVVLGYKSELVKEATRGLGLNVYINPRYRETGMLESLYTAKEKMADGFILIYGDVFFEPSIIKKLLESHNDFSIVVDNSKNILGSLASRRSYEEGGLVLKGPTVVHLVNNIVQKISKDLPAEETDAEYIGIAKFSARGAGLVRSNIESLLQSGAITKSPSFSFFFNWLIENKEIIHAVKVSSPEYAEIDSENDLVAARENFSRKIKGILFDGEDILYYRDEETLQPLIDFLRSYWHDVTADLFKQAYGKEALKLYQNIISKEEHLKGLAKNVGLPDSIFNEFKAVFQKAHPLKKIRVESTDVLQKLKRNGIMIGILTDTLSTEKSLREWLEKVGWDDFIDVVVCSSESGFTKDKKEAYEIALQRMQLQNQEVLFVGHQEYEMEGAQKAQVRTLSLTQGVGEDFFINNLSQLFEYNIVPPERRTESTES